MRLAAAKTGLILTEVMKPCCPGHNLGNRARGLSMRLGVFAAALTLGVGFVLAELGLASEWGFLLILPLTLSTYWLLSGLSGTCLMAGVRGGRQADYGFERVIDPRQMRGLRRRSLMLLGASLAVASIFSGAFAVSI